MQKSLGDLQRAGAEHAKTAAAMKVLEAKGAEEWLGKGASTAIMKDITGEMLRTERAAGPCKPSSTVAVYKGMLRKLLNTGCSHGMALLGGNDDIVQDALLCDSVMETINLPEVQGRWQDLGFHALGLVVFKATSPHNHLEDLLLISGGHAAILFMAIAPAKQKDPECWEVMYTKER